jgi:hypothetical protein
MAISAVNTTDLDGLFKKIYADKIKNLIPESGILVKNVPFVEKSKQNGDSYNQPVILTAEQGMTHAASDAGAFTLNDDVPMTTKNALVVGSQLLLRSAMSYEVAAKASNSTKAFVEATSLQVENMLESITKRVEILSLYGQSGIGVGDTSVNTDSTTTVVTLTTASWAIGIWSGSENTQLDMYEEGTSTLKNSNAALVVSAVDFVNLTLTITGNATDIAAVDTFLGSGNLDIYYYGAFGKEMAGLDAIITNTGTLFGISAATYSLWKGNSYSAGSANLTVDKVIKGINIPVGLGLMEAAQLHVSTFTWHILATEITGNRVYDDSYSTQMNANGTRAIKYYAQNGELEVICNPCVKQGEAFLFPKSKIKRLGAQDISFKTPGRGDEIFRQLDGKAGFEMRCYTDQAIFSETPARCLKYTNIVNS